MQLFYYFILLVLSSNSTKAEPNIIGLLEVFADLTLTWRYIFFICKLITDPRPEDSI